MSHLSHKTALHDIDDIEGFVNATINSWLRTSGIQLGLEERTELVGEGLLILAQLSDRYEPHREGYEQEGRFSGFAAQFLPRRLTDAWHRLNPHHEFATQPDGSRKWRYNPQAVSLDAMLDENPREDEPPGPSIHDQPALRVVDEHDDDDGFRQRLRPILVEQAMRDVDMAVEVGALLGVGTPPGEVCAELGIRSGELAEAVARIKRVAHRLTTQEAA